MSVFEYKAINLKGKSIKGIINSGNSTSAIQKLKALQIFPISIQEIDKANTKEKNPQTPIKLFSKIKSSEIAIITRQLSILLSSGFPLVSAIQALVPQYSSHGLKKLLAGIKDSLEEGLSFADALAAYPKVFSQIYINMVRAGEASGNLEIVLERLADIAESQQALSNRIRSALAYPILMSVLGVMVLFFLLAFIVPGITAIFNDMNQTLPKATLLLIGISNIITSYWWIFVIVIAGVAIIFKKIQNSPKGSIFIDKTILSVPVIGNLLKKMAIARFSRTLSSLLEHGVSMLSALEIVQNIVGNQIIAKLIEMAAKEVEKGEGLGSCLTDSDIFPPLSIQMIQVGEQSGELEKMLNKVADIFENEVESHIVTITSLIEPVIILFMACIVAFIVLSICLPIFEMNQLVR